jgi:hypothetical protein
MPMPLPLLVLPLLIEHACGCWCSALACCEEDRYVAVSTDNKKLTVWDTRGRPDGAWVCLMDRETSKKLNVLRFVRRYHGVEAGSGSIGLVVADRMGDVYMFHVVCGTGDAAGAGVAAAALEAAAKPGASTQTDFLAGHLSTVTAMVFTPDQSFLITAERDEKIRVSHFPNSYNIEAFCLGHTCHVSALAVAAVNGANLLVSGAVDGSLKLWSLPESEPLQTLMLEQPADAAATAAQAPAKKSHHDNEPVSHAVAGVDGIAYSAAAGLLAVSFAESKALAIVAIRPAKDGGDAGFQLVLRQWVKLAEPVSPGALSFGTGGDAVRLIVGAPRCGASVYTERNGAFVPE